MNKTVNINLGGFFFHIDENAYKKLRRYLDSISKSLSNDPQGRKEIIADIESRISELLSEKITDSRQAVSEGDIDEIIAVMGQPEDYSDTERSHYSYARNHTFKKKLFRDGNDKFLGGVASGIAHYLGVDAIWIRLGLLALLFLGVGFGFIIYTVLWILVPEAKTTAEKLQMEGEPVNIDNIEKKIRNEFTTMSNTVKDIAGDVSDTIADSADKLSKTDFSSTGSKVKSQLQGFLGGLCKIILAVLKVIGKFVGVILIFTAAVALISLLIGLFSVASLEVLNIDGNFIHYPLFFYDSILPKWLLPICVFILIGIPFIILFILGLRIVSRNVKQLSKRASLTLLGIWLVVLLTVVFSGVEFANSYLKYDKSIPKNVNIIAGFNNILLGFNKVNGNRNVITEDRKIHDSFSKIRAGSGINVYVTQDEKVSLTIEADENLHDYIKTEVENGVLKIYSDKNIWKAKAKKVHVHINKIEGVTATSGSNVYSNNAIKADTFKAKTSSGADMELHLEVNNLTSKSSSGSRLKLLGRATNYTASVSSGSSTDSYGLESETVTAKASSGADIGVYATKSIYARASSGGDIEYQGNPKSVDKKTSSGGSISAH